MDNFVKIIELPSEGRLPSREHFIPTRSISHITDCKVRNATIVVLRNGTEIATDQVTACQLIKSPALAGEIFSTRGEFLDLSESGGYERTGTKNG